MSNKAATIETIEPYLPRVRAVVERAWAEWITVAEFRASQGFPPVLYPRTLAVYVFDAIARYAIAEFGADPAISVKFDPQTVKFFFRGVVFARFKKGDDNHLGQGPKTQAELDFVDPNGILPGMPPETQKVEFIWIPNEIKTEIEQVLVVARDNERLVWEHEIPACGGAPILQLVRADQATDEDADDVVVTTKGMPSEAEGDDQDRE